MGICLKGSFNGYIIKVYGDGNLFFNDRYNYSKIFEIFQEVCRERRLPILFKPHLEEDPKKALCDIIILSKLDEAGKGAQDLATRLRNLNLFEQVEVKYQELDNSKLLR